MERRGISMRNTTLRLSVSTCSLNGIVQYIKLSDEVVNGGKYKVCFSCSWAPPLVTAQNPG